MNISHLFSSNFTGYQSNSASNLRSYCWYTRRSTDLHLSTSRSCSCLINPDAIYDQKQKAFWMSLGLDSNLEIALSPSVHRDYGMRFHNTWRILHRVRPSKCLKTHLFRLAHWGVVDYDSNYDNVQRFWTFYEWKRRYINSNYYYYYYTSYNPTLFEATDWWKARNCGTSIYVCRFPIPRWLSFEERVTRGLTGNVESYSIHGSFLKLEYLKTEFIEDNGTYAIVKVTSHSCRIMVNLTISKLFWGNAAPLKKISGCVSFFWQNVKTYPLLEN